MKKLHFKALALQTALFSTLCLGSYTLTHAETIQGVLEQSGGYSALFAASPESGDLIGYPFKNNSAVGKTILANCLPGLVCNVGKATTRNMRDTLALTFKDQPMGWMEVTQAANAGMVSAINNYEKSVKTRFGTLAVAADNVSLQMNGKPVLPGVAGNNSLSIAASYELGNADVVLVKNSGGSGCPAMYSFITLTKTNLRATPEFGTCSDIIRVTSDLKSAVTVVTVGFSGPFESAEAGRKAGMTKTVFRYANGQIMRASINIK